MGRLLTLLARTTPSAPAASASTTLSRGSVWLNGTTDYYTVPRINYPDADWAELFCIKFNRAGPTATQHIFNAGNFGGGASPGNVHLYLAGLNFNARVTNATGTVTIASTSNPIAPGIACDAAWIVACLRRVGANVEIAWCAKNGAAVTSATSAVAGLGAMTPNIATSTVGTRSDAAASTFLVKNLVSWSARVNGTISNAQLEALAAGQDLVADLGLSPLRYNKFHSLNATIPDESGNGNVATKVGTPALRGGPIHAGAPVTIDKTFDGPYGWGFQRAPGDTKKSVPASGSYTGSPGKLMVRALSVAGTQIAAPVAAAYPSAGRWKASLNVPQGYEYTLEAYSASDPTKFARTQNPWGVGMTIIPTGESIADGQASGSAFTEGGFAPNVERACILYLPDVWQNGNVAYTTSSRALDPTDYSIWKCNSNHNSPASGTFAADRAANPSRWTQLALADTQVDQLNASNGSIIHALDRIRSNLNIPVTAVFGAKTGSCLVANAPNNWGNYAYDVLHGKLKAAIYHAGGDAETLFWVQGANDANNASPPTSGQYQAALEALFPQIRLYFPLRTSATLDIHVPITGSNTAGGSPVDAGFRNVRTGTKAAIATVANCHDAGEMYDLPHVDSLHPNAAGNILLGKREAQSVLNRRLPGTFPNGMRGAEYVSASYSGNDIDIVFNLNGGTALQLATGSGNITGMPVKNASAVAKTISATSFPAANILRLTMGEAVGPGWTFDYVDTQNPTVTNCLYTNASVVGSTLGVPARSFTGPVTL